MLRLALLTYLGNPTTPHTLQAEARLRKPMRQGWVVVGEENRRPQDCQLDALVGRL
jgi:hypothetical protein